jgi:pimeloyl-ACP methyl ester carboxylesterase
MVASLVAVANPDKIGSVIMLEAFGPFSEHTKRVERLQSSFASRNKVFSPKVLPSVEPWIKARMHNAQLTEWQARIITERETKHNDKGWYRLADQRLKSLSPIRLTEEQVQGYLQQVSCPVLAVLAEDGYAWLKQHKIQRSQYFQRIKHLTLAGGHHFHMSPNITLAEEIQNFINNYRIVLCLFIMLLVFHFLVILMY